MLNIPVVLFESFNMACAVARVSNMLTVVTVLSAVMLAGFGSAESKSILIYNRVYFCCHFNLL